MPTDFRERPNTLPWPPIIFGGLALAALVLHWLLPISWPVFAGIGALQTAGAFLAAAGLIIDVLAAVTLYRHRTTIWPNKGSAHLVTAGPYAWSRNPIYLGNTLLMIGLGLTLAIAWLVMLAPVAAVLTHHLAIKREERHLAAAFGGAWLDYELRVRRWFGRKMVGKGG